MYVSFVTNVTARELRNWFYWHFIMKSFSKTCRHFPFFGYNRIK